MDADSTLSPKKEDYVPKYESKLIYNQDTDLKILAIGDVHFKISNIHESKPMSANIISIAKEMKPDLIIALGDLLDKHSIIHVDPLTMAISFLGQLKEIAPLYVIIGNHDLVNNSAFMTNQHGFNALKLWSNTKVVDSVYKETFKNKYELIFMPYVYPGRYLEGISHLPPENPDEPGIRRCHVAFGHQEFYGCKMGAIVSTQGDKWPHNYPLIISGHIHDYQRPQCNIVYTGTPMQHAHGDQNNKTISEFVLTPDMPVRTMCVDTDEDNTPLKHDDFANNLPMELGWNENRIDLGLMKRVICYINPSEINTWVPPQNKIVKLVIRGTTSQIKGIAGLDRLKELKDLNIRIVFKTIEDDNQHDLSDNTTKSGPQLPYLQSLELAASQDQGLQKLFTKIFGGTTEPKRAADKMIGGPEKTIDDFEIEIIE